MESLSDANAGGTSLKKPKVSMWHSHSNAYPVLPSSLMMSLFPDPVPSTTCGPPGLKTHLEHTKLNDLDYFTDL